MVGWADLRPSWSDVGILWLRVNVFFPSVVAVGGTDVFDIVVDGEYARVHVFEGSDDFTVLADDGLDVEYLVVAGGGGGGRRNAGLSTAEQGGAGGGGAGGLRTGAVSVSTGNTPIVVGSGGTGASGATAGGDGSPSAIGSLVSTVGGGGGGSILGFSGMEGRPGGSGGGGSASSGAFPDRAGGAGTAGEGNAGGLGRQDSTHPPGGGGGGAGAVGANGVTGTGGSGAPGGIGVESLITGTAVKYAGGGSGCNWTATSSNATSEWGGGGSGLVATDGVNGTGAGGGAAARATPAASVGKNGGSGVVIVRYLIPLPPYKPAPAVLIGGQDFTGDTIGQIIIRRGRDSVYVEPSASYASVNLRSVGTPLNLSIGTELSVTLNTTFGDRETLFRGRISDVEVSITPATPLVGQYRLTAVGPLAGANRRQVLAAGRDVEKDGERAEAAIIDALGTAIIATALFDEGVFDLAELDPQDGGYTALSIAQEAAASGGAVLYETRDGLIAYADADRRAAVLDQDDFTPVPAAILDLDGMNASSSLSELANRVVLDWDAGTVIEEVQDSIDEFGLFVRRISTVLNSEGDAEVRALDLAQNLSVPVFKADVFRLLINNAAAPLRDLLVKVEPNDGVSFRQLPSVIGFTRLDAFVEGVEWRIDPFVVELGLFASDERLSVGLVYWGRVDAALEWGDVDAGLEWRNVGRTL